jgi:hypothetical protein
LSERGWFASSSSASCNCSAGFACNSRPRETAFPRCLFGCGLQPPQRTCSARSRRAIAIGTACVAVVCGNRLVAPYHRRGTARSEAWFAAWVVPCQSPAVAAYVEQAGKMPGKPSYARQLPRCIGNAYRQTGKRVVHLRHFGPSFDLLRASEVKPFKGRENTADNQPLHSVMRQLAMGQAYHLVADLRPASTDVRSPSLFGHPCDSATLILIR